MTLTEFLLARIAEREAVAQRILDRGTDPATDPLWWCDEMTDHVAMAPTHVRAECEAKRRIVERASVECICTDHGHNRVDGCPQCVACHAVTMADGYVLADLALPDADHPDYDEEWKP